MSRFDAAILDGLDADMDSDASDAFDASDAADLSEAVRRRPAVATGKGLVRPRMTSGGGSANTVSRVEFQAAMARVGDQIKKNADGILSVNAKVGALLSATKKEAATRKKQVTESSGDVNSKLQMLALLPLLVKQPTVNVNAGAAPNVFTDSNGNALTGTFPLSQADNSSLDAILPLLLVSGMGGSAGGLNFGGSGGSDNNTMMMLVLALALSGGLGK